LPLLHQPTRRPSPEPRSIFPGFGRWAGVARLIYRRCVYSHPLCGAAAPVMQPTQKLPPGLLLSSRFDHTWLPIFFLINREKQLFHHQSSAVVSSRHSGFARGVLRDTSNSSCRRPFVCVSPLRFLVKVGDRTQIRKPFISHLLEADKRTSFPYVLITEQHIGKIGLSAPGLTQNSH